MKRRVEFYMWLFEQRGRKDDVGALARDVYEHRDEDVERFSRTMHDYKDYLKKRRAPEAVQKALEQAWWEYVDVLTEEKARREILKEIAAVVDRGLESIEDSEKGVLHVIDNDHVNLLKRLLQRLNEI